MATKSTVNPNMMLITSNWNQTKTFKAIAITKECPFVEAIYDPGSQILALISKDKKEGYHMLPKLDDNGDPVMTKLKARPDGKKYKEQRVLLNTYTEIYISESDEIESFIKMFCINAKDYDWKQYTVALPEAGGLDLLGTEGKTLEDMKLEGVDLKSV